ncbi:four and a half LIM domains protein 2-like isoform X2 [Centruroides vittatus]|uniref:four and a half LIM domains protein 2-like isoform X2 n=1 Tax=Centruroides vittatus TaxID=120091 RepID=UPI00350EA75F
MAYSRSICSISLDFHLIPFHPLCQQFAHVPIIIIPFPDSSYTDKKQFFLCFITAIAKYFVGKVISWIHYLRPLPAPRRIFHYLMAFLQSIFLLLISFASIVFIVYHKTAFYDFIGLQDRESLRKNKKRHSIGPCRTSDAFLVSSLPSDNIAKHTCDGKDNASDTLIFAGEYTKAMSKDWHSTHFCCWQCDETLTGQRYVLRDEHPYCVRCYEQVFSNTCDECGKPIGIDSKDLSYKEKHWHESCFLCNKCQMSLVDKPFGSKSEKVYCANCYDNSFASRCDACNEVFRAGTKKMEYKGKQWHEKCFCCIECNNPIGTKSFIPRDSDIFCTTCYEQKFSTRCVKCNQIITTGGVTYRNEPWHRECFCCTNCEMCLAGQRFTSRDEKPYCAECFGELFAKRCNACNRPITGIGGTRFISFEDRNWHNDCFLCASCNLSLVGKGFITDGSDILCPDCAKQKLM